MSKHVVNTECTTLKMQKKKCLDEANIDNSKLICRKTIKNIMKEMDDTQIGGYGMTKV